MLVWGGRVNVGEKNGGGSWWPKCQRKKRWCCWLLMRMFLSVTFCDLEKSTERSKTSRECWKIPLLSVCWLAAFCPPLVFCCRHFSAADCKLISCRAAWLGVLVLDFFRSHPTQFESSLKEKAASHRPFFCCPDRAFAGNPHHGNSTIPNCQMCTPLPPQPQPTSPNPTTKHFTHQPPRFITHPRFGSAISTKPKPKVSATRRKLSSRGGKEVYCVIHRVVLGGFFVDWFFSERKTGGKNTRQNQGGV